MHTNYDIDPLQELKDIDDELLRYYRAACLKVERYDWVTDVTDTEKHAIVMKPFFNSIFEVKNGIGFTIPLSKLAKGGSWREMYLTSPPINCMLMTTVETFEGDGGPSFGVQEFGDGQDDCDGITFGWIVDEMQAVSADPESIYVCIAGADKWIQHRTVATGVAVDESVVEELNGENSVGDNASEGQDSSKGSDDEISEA